jgi:methyl-accepting chemotaxis protein
MRTVEEQSVEVERVVERMTRLRAGSSQINQSIGEQGRSTEFVRESAGQIGDVAKRLSHSTEEQALATSGIRTNMESVRHAVAQISSALRDQAGSCRDVVAFLGELEGSTESNGQSVEQLELAAAAQQRVADVLQEEIARFRL